MDGGLVRNSHVLNREPAGGLAQQEALVEVMSVRRPERGVFDFGQFVGGQADFLLYERAILHRKLANALDDVRFGEMRLQLIEAGAEAHPLLAGTNVVGVAKSRTGGRPWILILLFRSPLSRRGRRYAAAGDPDDGDQESGSNTSPTRKRGMRVPLACA